MDKCSMCDNIHDSYVQCDKCGQSVCESHGKRSWPFHDVDLCRGCQLEVEEAINSVFRDGK